LNTIRIIRETIKNVKTAERMYVMGRRGYEKLKNPQEWEALKLFAKRRMELLLNPDVNPYDSSLAKMIKSLDNAMDNYMASVDSLRWISAKVDSTDSTAASWLDSLPFVGRLEKGEKWAGTIEGKAYARRYGSSQELINRAEAKHRDFQAKAEALKKEKSSIDQDNEKLKIALYAAQNAFTQSRFDMETKSSKDGAEQAKMNALVVRKATLELLERAKDDLEKRKTELTGRAAILAQGILENKDQMDRAVAVLGFQGTLQESWVQVSLSSMSQLSNALESVERIFFGFLVIALALGFLWHGVNAYRGGSDSGISHEAIMGLIWAFVFLFPASPLALHKMTQFFAVWTDGLTALFAKESGNPFGTLKWMMGNTMGALNEITGERTGVWNNVVGFASNGPSFAMAAAHSIFFGAIGFIFSLVGTVAVFGSLLLRNLLFWVLMILSPAFIFLAPLPYARKKLIPAWASMTYGTILWGPVIYIMLMVSNLMIGKMTDIAAGINSSSPLTDVFMNAFSSTLLVFAMIAAPFMVLGITQGSFGALSASISSIATTLITTGGSFAVVSGSIGLMGAGQALGVGGRILQAGGTTLNARGFNGIGDKAKLMGSGLMNAGSKINRAGTHVGNIGATLAKRSSGIDKLMPHDTHKKLDPSRNGAKGE